VLKSHLIKEPKSINVDFEKAVFNATNIVFKNTHIYGCYFHLTQNLWRRMVKLGLLEKYYSLPKFKSRFLLLKALVYVPESDMVFVFNQLQSTLGSEFKPLFKYFRINYVGTKKKKARFPFATWNLFVRVLNELPRTNNTVESWHSAFTSHEKKDLTINLLVEKIRKEQSKTEIYITLMNTGQNFEREEKQVNLDKLIYYLVSSYKKADCMDYLKNISLITIN
jgi:hypothetical protein